MTRAVQNLFFPEEGFDWLAWRKKGLGGSDAPIIMNASPWMTRLELWEIRTGRRPSPETTYPMRMGIKNEPVARAWYEQKRGIDFPKALAIHPRYDFIRLSLDGINTDLLLPIEIKCPGKEDHFTALSGKVPDKYVWQLEHYLLVLNVRQIDYVSWNPKCADDNSGEDATYLTYYRDDEKQADLLEALHEFWECIRKDVPPPAEPPCYRRNPMPTLKLVKPSLFKVRKEPTAYQRAKNAKALKQKKYLEPRPQKLGAHSPVLYQASELIEVMRTAKELGVTKVEMGELKLEFGK